MKYSKFLNDLKDEFYKGLEVKTSWGRNELKTEFERATIRVLAKYLEKASSSETTNPFLQGR